MRHSPPPDLLHLRRAAIRWTVGVALLGLLVGLALAGVLCPGPGEAP